MSIKKYNLVSGNNASTKTSSKKLDFKYGKVKVFQPKSTYNLNYGDSMLSWKEVHLDVIIPG
jgi:hypothetical protein